MGQGFFYLPLFCPTDHCHPIPALKGKNKLNPFSLMVFCFSYTWESFGENFKSLCLDCIPDQLNQYFLKNSPTNANVHQKLRNVLGQGLSNLPHNHLYQFKISLWSPGINIVAEFDSKQYLLKNMYCFNTFESKVVFQSVAGKGFRKQNRHAKGPLRYANLGAPQGINS